MPVPRSRLAAVVLALGALATASAQPGAARADGELPRRGLLGARLAPAPDGAGVVVDEAFPGRAAARAGLASGDVIVEAGGKRVGSVPDLLAELRALHAGERIDLVVADGAKRREVALELDPFPVESGEGVEVELGHVEVDGDRLRTIVTRPAGETTEAGAPRPAVLFVTGIGCGSVDNPLSPFSGITELLHGFSRDGFITLRVEKPGVGDSEGGPCPELDFEEELAGHRAGLAALKTTNGVDPERVFVVGLSMGGVMAPYLAAEGGLAGAVVYGTVFRPWADYELTNFVNQWRMEGLDPVEVEERQRRHHRFVARFYTLGESLPSIARDHPDAVPVDVEPPAIWAGKHWRFFRQLGDLELAAAWKAADAPVLAAWGSSDFVSDRLDHELLVAAVEQWRPGTATLAVIPGVDHWFNRAEDFRASQQQGPVGGTHDAAFRERATRWMKERAAEARSVGATPSSTATSR